ncbi:MAG: NAD-dependent deacetylase [Firmicutes bacterium]|nr:NAD-dependent deacetylase [Bacillota bacterium]
MVDLLQESKHTVALTGAGISTDSGIPDFRSPGEGFWTKVNPIYFTIHGFKKNPAEFYRFGMGLFQDVLNAQPNRAHLALAELQQRGLLHSVVTQNIDGLHQKAGSKRVFEVHGNMRGASCFRGCAHRVTIEEVADLIFEGQMPPLCKKCGRPLKPDVVLFGESMAPDFNEAINEVRAAELILIIGASMRVAPVNMLPRMAKNLVIINRERTMHDRRAKVVIHGGVSEAARLILEELDRRAAGSGS